MAAVLLNQTTGESVVIQINRAPEDRPAVLPTSPVSEGIPAVRTRYELPTTVDLGIVLARVPGTGISSNADVVSFIDAAAFYADRITYQFDDDPAITDLKIGNRQTSRSPGTTTVLLNVILTEVRALAVTSGAVAFPDADATARPGVEGRSDGGKQSGTDGPAPGLAASILGIG